MTNAYPQQTPPKNNNTLVRAVVGGVLAVTLIVIGGCLGALANSVASSTPQPAVTVTETEKVEVEKKVEVPGPTVTVTAKPEEPKQQEEETEPESTELTWSDLKAFLEAIGVTVIEGDTDGTCIEGGYGSDYMAFVVSDCANGNDAVLDQLVESTEDEGGDVFTHYVRGDNWLIFTQDKATAKNVKSILGGKVKKL